MTKHPAILLTNDDGYASPGIKHLYEALSPHHTVIVVAPKDEQSGIGHAFTFNKPLRFAKLPDQAGMPGYMVAGTPSDCVKFAVSYLLTEKPDVVISGLNSGENSGISGFYSGTVAAAREGSFWRIPSFAFSLSGGNEAFFAGYARQAVSIVNALLATDVASSNGRQVFYNINFPACAPDKCRGNKITRQSLAFFDDRYERILVEKDQEGFVIYGEKTDVEASDEYDSRALMNDYTTITPLCFDATAHWVLPDLSPLER